MRYLPVNVYDMMDYVYQDDTRNYPVRIRKITDQEMAAIVTATLDNPLILN